MSGKPKRPRRLFRARRSGPAIIVEPAFRRRPHYSECLDILLERHADEIRAGAAAGKSYGVEIQHDSWCPALKGGICDCDCVVNLIERGNPEEN
jgi:hypothetical protein